MSPRQTLDQLVPEKKRKAAVERIPIRRALLSVFYKDGVVELAKALAAHGAELLSTGGTMQVLKEAGLAVTEVADYTGFPEMMDGRVKTLHPKIHGGLLGRRDLPGHLEAMEEHRIGPIDMVCVNLYPFEETVASPGATRQEIIEKIDIGGPSMLRSAAKNHDAVAVVCDPSDYREIIHEIEKGGTSLATRRRLARKAFQRTASYDAAISQWFLAEERQNALGEAHWPERILLAGRRRMKLRYGENPHQGAAFYADFPGDGLGNAEILPGGKEISYNNLLDLDGAMTAVNDLPSPAAVVVKHTNPCGAAVRLEDEDSLAEILDKAWQGDPLSAFGSVIAVNAPFDLAAAEFLCSGGKFVEVLAAPEFSQEAVELIRTKPKWGKNLRLVKIPALGRLHRDMEARRVAGGFLVQESDSRTGFDEELKTMGAAPLPAGRDRDLRLAQTLVKHLKSNAVCLVKDGMLIGAGAGQMSRVDSAKIAVEKAGKRAKGAVAGSDAFFPFPDGVQVLAEAGVVAVAQPGGSVKDGEVTAAANARGVAMVHTGTRHFRH
ncbi:MAG: bifunctional phosphoribosylaminoimidazolecarboxamide formyltransferase/IMP cyclohydrolase PurH [Planctomycetota bacterium]|nr:MAG: bifunctional phosphoribosylaminoimidazolecarboxamide formyltransferase/IMP cyclohydrolase PurH [Planctomycetota bacterium]